MTKKMILSKLQYILLTTLSLTPNTAFLPNHNLKPFTKLSSTRTGISETSTAIKELQSELNENEDVNLILQALRGNNLNDDDVASSNTNLQLVTSIYKDGTDEQLPLYYDPVLLKEFFDKRPSAVLNRLVQIVTVGSGFMTNVILDKIFQRTKNNPDLEVQRVAELRDVITSLGPFFIKIGQALSIRPDVLSPRSMVELQKLCDKVPSYDSVTAFQTIEKELGVTMEELFDDITAEPVAAASLGQVYKAKLKSNGDIVAVKVQRPFVLETVSLDLYLVRQIGLFVRNFPYLVDRLDIVSLLDEFAYRFYQELDYDIECDNGIKIKEQMAVLDNVVIPKNYPDFTARRVHVAEWIEGEKLSQSTADDVGALVNLGVITYLTQLLEYGFFHADPHPGNMMRTTDGKLAILDFGLMTEVTDNQKYGMIEAIAHLINRDYSEIGQDFINLDFIPQNTDVRPIVPALTKVFDVALAGGGAKSINFQELAADLAQITFEYPFRIPPYFALVIRAISVLEGIALVGNPDFAIIDEAYPYIARRLMTDKSPRLRSALKYMVYGQKGQFDAEKVIDLLQALEKFTAVKDEGDGSAFKVDGVRGSKDVGKAGDFAGSQKVDISDRASVEKYQLTGSNTNDDTLAGSIRESLRSNNDDERTVREALRFFFSPEGDVFREFLLEEIVTVVDASSRDAVRAIASNVPGLNAILPRNSLLRALAPELTKEDKVTVEQIQTLIQFLFGDFDVVAGGGNELQNAGGISRMQRAQQLFMNGGNGSTTDTNNARVRKLLPIVREYAPQLRDYGTLLVARLTEKNISRGLNWANDRIATASAR